MDLSNPNIQKLIDLVSKDARFHRRTGDDAAFARFLAQYPKDKLQSLSLEDYVLGKGSKPESFCWWFERGLEKVLGRYMPGTAKAHLLYRQPDGVLYKHRRLADLADSEALAYILKLQSVFASADPTQPLDWLDDRSEVLRRAGLEERMPMGEGRRMRLLSIYNPDTVLPIYSSEHIAHFLEQLGYPAEAIPPYQQVFARHKLLYEIFQQVKAKVPLLTPFGFVQALYSEALGIRPVKNIEPDDEESTPESQVSTWDSATIHRELKALGYELEPGKIEPAYAFEHSLGAGKYVYVKGRQAGNVRKAPLVIHPSSVASREDIDQIADIRVHWSNPVKNTSYRHFPRFRKESQHGIPVDVSSGTGLKALIEILEATNDNDNHVAEPKMEATIFPEFPLNQILFGPPGTGKTYRTTELAVRIAEPEQYQRICETHESLQERRLAIKDLYDRLVQARRIDFTTFHQSFAYEDFIEGIRAQVNEEGALAYDVEDGTFKQLATLADADRKEGGPSEKAFDLEGRRIWKMSLGNTLKGEEDRYLDCIENDYIGLGWGDSIDFSDCNSREAVSRRFEQGTGEKPESNAYKVTAVNLFKNVIHDGDIVVVSDGNHKFRAIAEVTGAYRFIDNEQRAFYQTRPVRWLRIFESSLPKEALFHKALVQRTLYELKPSTIKLDQLQAYLTVGDVSDGGRRNFVLIIDEINRGNIARIFGELITLLEPDKRKDGNDARAVLLPYSKEPFTVPSNLYVIGTMNTADKSLAQLDLALRRRFAFIEMLPQPELLGDVTVHGVSIAELLTTINNRIEVLLDRDHLIGHSYFLPLLGPGIDKEATLADIFASKLIPLLQEYFFADWERIRWVLNDLDKAREHQFVQLLQEEGGLAGLFSSKVVTDLHDRRYRINRAAFDEPAAYQGVLVNKAP